MRLATSLLVLAVLAPVTARAQTSGTISGTVTAEDGRPIQGVSVNVTGTLLGRVTEANGRYTIVGVPVGTQTVVARRLGFAPQSRAVTVILGQTTTADFTLAVQAAILNDVVAIGYGNTSVRNLSGAVAVVSGTELKAEGVPLVTLSEGLAGKAPGIQVSSNSGIPGAGARVRVRGTASINANSEPLYVIDGVPVLQGSGSSTPTSNPLGSLEPSDIESVQILKDAASTAIYGSRGSNGVIVIETRHGRRGESGVDFEASYGMQTISNRIPVLSGPDFMTIVNESRTNAGLAALYTPAQIAAAPTYDYQNMMLRTAPQTTQAITFHGGESRLRYLIGANHTKVEGILINSRFTRYGGRLNLDSDVSERFRVGTTMMLTRTEQLNPSEENGALGNGGNGILAAMFFNPTSPPRDTVTGLWIKSSPGTSEQVPNPVANAREQTGRATNTQLFGTTYLQFDILSNLRLQTNLAGNFGFSNNYNFSPRTILSGGAAGTGSLSSGQSRDLTSSTTLNYNQRLGPGELELLGGFEAQTFYDEGLSGTETGLPTDATTIYDIGSSIQLGRGGSSLTEAALQSYLARVNYNIADKYLFMATARRDGSSKFGANNKWAFFPSASVAWRISEEGFMRDFTLIDDLKLRLSSGVSGNQAIGSYQTLSRLNSGFVSFGQTEVATLAPSATAPNPNLRWEKTTDVNVGVDLSILRNRITANFDVYRKTTKDLLFNASLPNTTGFSNQTQNIGSVKNRGVELGLSTVNIQGRDLTWRSTFNISANRSEVVNVGATTEACRADANVCQTVTGRGITGAGATHILQPGQPLGTIYGFKVLGLWQQGDTCDLTATAQCTPGEYKLQDTNGDRVITNADRVRLGTGEPKFYGGFSNNVTFRRFSLNAFLNYQQGNKIVNGGLAYGCQGQMQLNERTCMLDRWTPTNTNTNIPRANNTRIRRVYSTLVEDGSFVRLSSLTLAYQIPDGLAPRMHSARVFVTGQNLWLHTNYSGFDPEVSSSGSSNTAPGVDAGAYPRSKVWNFGIAASY